MIITNRYWLEEKGSACFPSGAKKSIPFVLTVKPQCSNMVVVGERPFLPTDGSLTFISEG